MNAWWSLTKKEFQLGLPAFLVAFILFLGIIGGGYFIGNYVGYTEEMLTAALGFVVMLHIFFLPFYLYHSLNTERKRLHLWLHSPMSIASLISSKIVTGVVFMIFTFIISIVLFVQFFHSIFGFFIQETIFNLIGSVTFYVFTLAIFITAIFLFFWSIYLMLSQLMNDFISFVLTFILFLILSWAYGAFIDLPIMQTLTNWGSIQVNGIIAGFEINFHQNGFESQVSETSVLYIGPLVRDIIVAGIMFIGACWMIEKKVEV